MEVPEMMIQVVSRILPKPTVQYRSDKRANILEGSWRFDGLRFYSGTTLQQWCFLIIIYRDSRVSKPPNDAVIYGRMSQFIKILGNSGIEVKPPTLTPQLLIINNPNDLQLDQCFKCLKTKVSFLVIILPAQETPLHSRVKQLADIEHGIHTACAVGSIDKKFCKE